MRSLRDPLFASAVLVSAMVATAFLTAGTLVWTTILLVAVGGSVCVAGLHYLGWRGAPHLKTFRDDEWRAIYAVFVLAGFALAAYSPIKSWLNQFGFWADPALAALETIMFGTDPIRWLRWMAVEPLMVVYAQGWIPLMLVALGIVARARSHLVLTFFLIWGPASLLLQALYQSAGPILYDPDRYGPFPALAEHYADYLVSVDKPGVGTGISAMPSVHVMVAAWLLLVAWHGPWRWPALAFLVLIFLLSIASGWHYALDGLIGMTIVFALHRILGKIFATTNGSERAQTRLMQGA